MDSDARLAELLYVILAMRDGKPVLTAEMSEDFSDGYRQALADLAQWGIEDLALPKPVIKRLMAHYRWSGCAEHGSCEGIGP